MRSLIGFRLSVEGISKGSRGKRARFGGRGGGGTEGVVNVTSLGSPMMHISMYSQASIHWRSRVGGTRVSSVSIIDGQGAQEIARGEA